MKTFSGQDSGDVKKAQRKGKGSRKAAETQRIRKEKTKKSKAFTVKTAGFSWRSLRDFASLREIFKGSKEIDPWLNLVEVTLL